MDMGEQRLDAGDERLAVEQLADRDRGVERGGVAACQARAHRSALRLAVAEMQPAKAPARASSSTASVDGNTLKSRRDRRGLARIGHVAGGILQPDDAPPNGASSRRISATCQGRPDCAGK